MAESDKEKAAEILKKRRLAAKGLEPRPDGKAVDPMEDYADPDADPNFTKDEEDKQQRIAKGAVIAGTILKR